MNDGWVRQIVEVLFRFAAGMAIGVTLVLVVRWLG